MRTAAPGLRLLAATSASLMIMLFVCMLGLLTGSVTIEPAAVWQALTSPDQLDDVSRTILIDIRLPRLVLGLLVGACLSVAGCGFQGILRNPLADPYIVGTSAGASLGATIAIVLHVASPLAWLSPVPLFAFVGALAAMLVVYKLARIGGTLPVETFLLAGVVVGSFAGALVSFLMTLADQDLHRVVLWLMGSLGQTDLGLFWMVAPYLLIGGAILCWLSPALNIISMGDETASSLGINVERLKILVIMAGSLVTAAAVAAAGLIGFLGLVVPHLVRMIVGPDHRVLIPVAAINGASFLVLADTVARTVANPQELPVGVITALVGAPFFFWLLHKKRKLS